MRKLIKKDDLFQVKHTLWDRSGLALTTSPNCHSVLQNQTLFTTVFQQLECLLWDISVNQQFSSESSWQSVVSHWSLCARSQVQSVRGHYNFYVTARLLCTMLFIAKSMSSLAKTRQYCYWSKFFVSDSRNHEWEAKKGGHQKCIFEMDIFVFFTWLRRSHWKCAPLLCLIFKKSL